MSPNFLTILANCLYLDFLRFPPTTESGERKELNGGAGAMCPERLCRCFREQSFPATFHEISLLTTCSLASLGEFVCADVLSRFAMSSRLPSCPSLGASLLQKKTVHDNKVLTKLISVLKYYNSPTNMLLPRGRKKDCERIKNFLRRKKDRFSSRVEASSHIQQSSTLSFWVRKFKTFNDYFKRWLSGLGDGSVDTNAAQIPGSEFKPQHPGYKTAEHAPVQLCTVSLARVDTRGRLWFPIGQPSSKFSERSCLKKAMWGWREQDT